MKKRRRTVASDFGLSPGSQASGEIAGDLRETIEVWTGNGVEEVDVGLGESSGDETVLFELVCQVGHWRCHGSEGEGEGCRGGSLCRWERA